MSDVTEKSSSMRQRDTNVGHWRDDRNGGQADHYMESEGLSDWNN